MSAPTKPKSDAATARIFDTLLPRDARIAVRPMFGHRAAFVNGHMFAGTFGADVFVRLDEPSRVRLLSIAGTTPFAPMKNRPMKEYVVLPRVWLATGSPARSWIAKALAYGAALPPKAAHKTRPGRASSAKRKPA
jgi:TfoX/Sxy family transcriptional regulator of competence genes